MDKIFIWWYCKIDNPNEMLKYARFNLVGAETEEEAIKIIDIQLQIILARSHLLLTVED